MKLIIEDVNYKGTHIDRYESEMPGVKDFETIPFDKLEVYLKENMDALIGE